MVPEQIGRVLHDEKPKPKPETARPAFVCSLKGPEDH
jgi:hypothetical protein